MIRRRTVLVLGAGASAPYGFPVGRKLLMDVVEQLRNHGSYLNLLLKECRYDQDFVEAFRENLAWSMQPSIDAFLESREEFLELGKIAIAASLIPYESEGNLQRQPGQVQWYEYLFGRIGPTFEDYRTSAGNISVLSFNYDRSFEHSLYLALKASFGLPRDKALELRQRVRVLHLYGDLGQLDYESDNGRPYEPINNMSAAAARKWARGIRVLHESTVDDEVFRQARAVLEPAEVVCFLGFGYHPRNVERLGIGNLSRETVAIHGSVLGLGGAEIQEARLLLGNRLQPGGLNEDALQFLRNHAVLS